MSVYEGTLGQQEYRHGFDNGRADAGTLAEQGFSDAVSRVAITGAEEYARNTMSDNERAYWLGWLRGFREISR